MANNFTCDKYSRVKVLYDYDYTDEHDNTPVFMRTDEIFFLLNSDIEEWWQVCRPDSPDKHFYVPSAYVTVLQDVSSRVLNAKANTNMNENRQSGGNTNMEQVNGQSEKISDKTIYANVSPVVSDNSVHVQYHGHLQRPTNLTIQTEDDYVNLEEFRKQAGLPTPDQSPLDSGDKVYKLVSDQNLV